MNSNVVLGLSVIPSTHINKSSCRNNTPRYVYVPVYTQTAAKATSQPTESPHKVYMLYLDDERRK